MIDKMTSQSKQSAVNQQRQQSKKDQPSSLLSKQSQKGQQRIQVEQKQGKQIDLPKKQKKLLKHLSPIISSQHYTSLNIKHLGNHSLWKRTTFETRYNDDRLKLIKPQYFFNKYVLDIGCNDGFLDIEIAMRFFPKQIYAIDIDYRLIKNARKTLYTIVKKDKNYNDLVLNQKGSFQKSYQPSQEFQQNITKQTICNKIQDLPLFFQDRLKNKFSLDFYLPTTVRVHSIENLKNQNKFPFNIKFQADNIYTIKYQEDKLQYDTIICLKVTKWIHLTFGDDGIRRLFQKLYDLLRLDGILILQAQDWFSYKRKKNMFQIYKQNYENIRLGPDQFESVLINDPLREFKFQLVEKIQQYQRSEKGDSKLGYPILVLKKKSTMLYY